MKPPKTNNPDLHREFLHSDQPHLLMITNHGVHQWNVIPGLPDTGGQNVFVNQFTQSLSQYDYRITVVNRGGYAHPRTGEFQKGIRYHGPNQRILYLEDEHPHFVRKEDMGDHLPALVDSLIEFITDEGDDFTAVISHYWDAGVLGTLWNLSRERPLPHIWVPHSLGAIKRRNVDPGQWTALRIDERIRAEKNLLQQVDAVAATSTTIRSSLEADYGYAGQVTFLPPCVDPKRYHPRSIIEGDPIWSFLSEQGQLAAEELTQRKIITEISRTDSTKRKDILIRAFAQVKRTVPEALLVLSIDENEKVLSDKLHGLIRQFQLESSVVVVGSVWEQLPRLYAISEIYCTPSVMEGFGMSAQEAAASAVPVIASNLVPFATEFLQGTDTRTIPAEAGASPLLLGEGAIIVEADDVEGFAKALRLLLEDKKLRERMGKSAYDITIPAFTWAQRTISFLEELGLPFQSPMEDEPDSTNVSLA